MVITVIAGWMMELILPMQLKNIQQMILVCMIWLGSGTKTHKALNRQL
jgi:hypothetical protein